MLSTPRKHRNRNWMRCFFKYMCIHTSESCDSIVEHDLIKELELARSQNLRGISIFDKWEEDLWLEGMAVVAPEGASVPVLDICLGFDNNELNTTDNNKSTNYTYTYWDKVIDQNTSSLFPLDEYLGEPLVDGLPVSIWMQCVEPTLNILVSIGLLKHRKCNLTTKKSTIPVDSGKDQHGDIEYGPHQMFTLRRRSGLRLDSILRLRNDTITFQQVRAGLYPETDTRTDVRPLRHRHRRLVYNAQDLATENRRRRSLDRRQQTEIQTNECRDIEGDPNRANSNHPIRSSNLISDERVVLKVSKPDVSISDFEVNESRSKECNPNNKRSQSVSDMHPVETESEEMAVNISAASDDLFVTASKLSMIATDIIAIALDLNELANELNLSSSDVETTTASFPNPTSLFSEKVCVAPDARNTNHNASISHQSVGCTRIDSVHNVDTNELKLRQNHSESNSEGLQERRQDFSDLEISSSISANEVGAQIERPPSSHDLDQVVPDRPPCVESNSVQFFRRPGTAPPPQPSRPKTHISPSTIQASIEVRELIHDMVDDVTCRINPIQQQLQQQQQQLQQLQQVKQHHQIQQQQQLLLQQQQHSRVQEVWANADLLKLAQQGLENKYNPSPNSGRRLTLTHSQLSLENKHCNNLPLYAWNDDFRFLEEVDSREPGIDDVVHLHTLVSELMVKEVGNWDGCISGVEVMRKMTKDHYTRYHFMTAVNKGWTQIADGKTVDLLVGMEINPAFMKVKNTANRRPIKDRMRGAWRKLRKKLKRH